MNTEKRLIQEIEDEHLKCSLLSNLCKGLLMYTVFLLILVSVCIWSKDFRRSSVFSPRTGKLEKVEPKTEVQAPAVESKAGGR